MRGIGALIIVLSGLGAAHAAEPPPYIVAYSDTHPFAQGLVAFLTEAYRRVGQPIEARALPPGRSVEMANRGEVDAEAARVPDAMAGMSELVAVPEPLGGNDSFAFTTGRAVEIDGWESLRPYRLCVTVGDLVAMKRTEGMRRETAHDMAAQFRMLASRRCEVAVADASAWLTIDQLRLGHFQMMEKSIQTFAVYHYVNRRHADLVPALAAAIRALHEEGFDRSLLAPYMEKLKDSQARNSVTPPS